MKFVNIRNLLLFTCVLFASCDLSVGDCTGGWLAAGSDCYKLFSSQKLTFSAAQKFCVNQGGNLFKDDTADVHKQLMTYVKNEQKSDTHPSAFWIGLTDNGKDKGPWVWIGFGDTLGSTTFFQNTKVVNTASKQDCFYVSPNDKDPKWRMTNDCNTNKAFICQRSQTAQVQSTSAPINCPKDWNGYPSGNTCFRLYRSPKIWTDARLYCQENGGDLAKIPDAGTNGFINNLVSNNKGSYWIGLNDRHQEKTFSWLDETVKANYTRWDKREPSGGDENCVIISGVTGMKWRDRSCQMSYRFICQSPPTDSTPETLPPTTSNPNCGAGWDGRADSNNCYQINVETLSWLDALSVCKRNGGNLATMSDADEQEYLFGRIKSLENDFFWIGAHDRMSEGGWQWADKGPFAFVNWDAGQPHNGLSEDCVAMSRKSGRWFDNSCRDRYGYVCEKQGKLTTKAPPKLTSPSKIPSNKMWGCPEGWMGDSNSCYKANKETVDWTTAQTKCKNAKSQLVSISGLIERNFVYSLVPQNYKGLIWIGLKDNGKKNMFEWSDGSPVTYTIWNMNEPKNLKDEDCVAMRQDNRKWSSVKCSDKLGMYICKQSKIIVDKHIEPEKIGCDKGVGFKALCYVFNDAGKSYGDSQQQCQKAGGNLATVDGNDVQSFLAAEVATMSKSSYMVGLSLTSQTKYKYKWQSGAPVSFTAWSKAHKGNENNTCVAMQKATPAGRWINIPCDKTSAFICELPRKGFTTLQPVTTTVAPSPCPSGWSVKGNLCYKSFTRTQDQKLSWTEARDFCASQASGGSLVSVQSKDFETWMIGSFLKGVSGNFWIGLNDRDAEGGYLWQDGSPFKYANWMSGQPDDALNQEDCVQWALPQNNWMDSYCYIANDFICQVPKGSQITTPKPLPSGSTSNKCDNSSWVMFNDYCYFVSPPSGDMALSTWFEAWITCQDMNSDFVTIYGDDENGFLTGLISKHPISSFWIGLNDLDENKFSWTDNSRLSYINWAQNEPNDAFGEESCVEMTSNGQWNDNNCQEKFGYICKTYGSDYTFPMLEPTTAQGGCPTGYSTHPLVNFCYFVGGTTNSTRQTFSDAITSCQQGGVYAQLASVHSYAEQNFITTLIADLSYPAWIGLNDRKRRNSFQWVDNRAVDYTNWGPKQPDENLNDDSQDARRDCVFVDTAFKSAGDWNDDLCTNTYAYVCAVKKDPSLPTQAPDTSGCTNGYQRFSSSCYKFYDKNIMWNAAETMCNADGAHLVTISGRKEQSYVELLTLTQDSLELWTGVYFDEIASRYTSKSGNPLTYTNWGDGEPNKETNGGCVSHTLDGRWQDANCNLTLPFVCEIQLDSLPKPTVPVNAACADDTWSKLGANCYLMQADNPRSWPEARYECGLLGGELASIHSDTEARFLTQMITTARVDAWIGLNRGQTFGFSWSDQTAVDYQYWDQGEPSDPDKYMHQDCVTASGQDGAWADTDCFDKNAFICQASVGPMPSTPGQKGSPGQLSDASTQRYTNDDSSLSDGSIAGIVIGSILGSVVILGLAVFLLKGRLLSKTKRRPSEPPSEAAKGFDNALYSRDTSDNISLSDC